MFSATFSASDVLPMDGRAASTIRSESWSPSSISSMCSKPVERPVIPFFSEMSRSTSFISSSTRRPQARSALMRCSLRAKKDSSASTRTDSASDSPL